MTEEARKDAKALREITVDDCVDFPHVVHTMLHKAADLIESLSEELEQVKRERDAAVEDLKQLCTCKNCIGYEEFQKPDGNIDRCVECEERDRWQWRGVKEE